MRLLIITKKQLIVALAAFVGVSFAFFGTAEFASNTVAASNRLIPIYSVRTEEKKVAITFDAAWGANDTDELIAILEKYNAKSTIFVVGDWATKYPESVKAFHGEGHEIANHSASHAAFPSLSRDGVSKEITGCNKIIKELTGEQCKIVRAPSGDYDNASIEVAKELGMVTIQWSVDSLDWKGISVDDMVTRVTEKTKNGDILLFHNDVENTPAALDKILDNLSKQGYKFVTVSELIYKENYEINLKGEQIFKG